MENHLKINQEKIGSLEESCNNINNEITKMENKHCNEVKKISNF